MNMVAKALAHRTRGTEEKTVYLLVFTNILDITQVRTSKTHFLIRKLQCIRVGCY